jgi:hypothetical protein
LEKNPKNKNISFNLNDNIIKCEDVIKLLGVTIDSELNFNTHIANICIKASRQNLVDLQYTTLLFSRTLIIAL